MDPERTGAGARSGAPRRFNTVARSGSPVRAQSTQWRERRPSAAAWLGVVFVSALLAAGVVALDVPGAFAIAFGLTAIGFGAAVAYARPAIVQNTLLSLASISLCLAAAETGALILKPLDRGGGESTAIVDDPDLGFRPKPNQRAAARRTFANGQEWAATYTFDDHGLRVMPSSSAPCKAAFFSDSFTFGYGLQDDETIPYRFVQASGGVYRGYNFSFNGYGPHQMLRAIETGRIEQVIGAPPDLVIYQGLVDHLRRIRGGASWDQHGPKYVLSEDGGARYAGPFHGKVYADVTEFLFARSALFHYFFARLLASNPADAIPLYISVLKQARSDVERRYGAAFVVVFWDADVYWPTPENALLVRTIMQRLSAEQFHVVPISTIIPDVSANLSAYTLTPGLDLHPNAAAAKRIGQFLAARIGPLYCTTRQ